ncbi:hypothetical protein BGZ95_008527 [Linnemannia exigua]|uniref:F-box domain-containing protein n=1 Tax=Linnemannia exigua TaxID=604196 RepID=A0AAD4H794_9FUNG|nr:hypothetical protein BGZ95_008527 [Linnemannia exigua]
MNPLQHQPQPSQDMFSIPELIEEVGLHLNPPDLLSCIQVNQHWHTHFIPLLWRTIDDSLYSWPHILRGCYQESPDLNDDEDGDGGEEAGSESDRDSTSAGSSTNTTNSSDGSTTNSFDNNIVNSSDNTQWVYHLFTKYGSHIRILRPQYSVTIDAAYLGGRCTSLLTLDIAELSSNYMSYTGPLPTDSQEEGEEQEIYYDCLSPALEGTFEPRWETPDEGRRLRDWNTQQCLWLLIRRNLGLQSLQLTRSLAYLASLDSATFAYDTLALLPNLTRFRDSWLFWNIAMLLEKCPQLRDFSDYSDQGIYTNLQRPFDQLRCLRGIKRFTSQDFFTVLKYLPNLETLCFSNFDKVAFKDGDAAMRTTIFGNTPSRLQELDFYILLHQDHDIAHEVIPWIPHLVKLRTNQLYPAVAKALGTHCRKLEEFSQTYNGESTHPRLAMNIAVNIMGELLRGCPKLRIFDGIQHGIEASQFDQHFVCTQLEVLRCRIVGVRRLNLDEEAILARAPVAPTSATAIGEGMERSTLTLAEVLARIKLNETLMMLQESIAQQQRIMSRLARLTRLKTLDLGMEWRDLYYRGVVEEYILHTDGEYYVNHAKPSEDTLSLTLESGLSRLATLRDLEVFGFEGVNHRIEEEEVSWMANAWPRMKVLRGLHVDTLVGALPDAKRHFLRGLMQTLRPSVEHAAVEDEY